MAKMKRSMSGAEKLAAQARKEPRTTARKKARRDAQRERELRNKVEAARGNASPWQVACALRAAGRRGVSGAA